MDQATAKELLLIHGVCLPDDETDPRTASGFLGSLRPYKGHLDERNFHEVMAAVRALGSQLASSELDREVISALWGICHLARSWGVDPDGLLRQDDLIDEADVETLDGWVEMLSYAVMGLLDGWSEEEAFADYDREQRPKESTP